MRLLTPLLLAGLLLIPVSVLAAPPPPFSPYGTVKLDGANVADGTVVSAWCGGVQYKSTTTQTQLGESWYFNFDVPGDDPATSGVKEGCSAGEIVSFQVAGRIAAQTAAWASGSSRLDLTATSSPTAVTLASLAAVAQGDRVRVSWETVSEVDNRGFNLYRSASVDGARTLLTFVPAAQPASALGARYAFEDDGVARDASYWYWLEDVALDGATELHGPVHVRVQSPTAVGLRAVQASGDAAPGWLVWVAALGVAGAITFGAGLFFGRQGRRGI